MYMLGIGMQPTEVSGICIPVNYKAIGFQAPGLWEMNPKLRRNGMLGAVTSCSSRELLDTDSPGFRPCDKGPAKPQRHGSKTHRMPL